MNYEQKYIKYKNKYNNLKEFIGGKLLIIEEENYSNFGHINLVNGGMKPLPPRELDSNINNINDYNNQSNNKYSYDLKQDYISNNSSNSNYQINNYNINLEAKTNEFDKNKHINEEIKKGTINPINDIFKLYRYGLNSMKNPKSSDEACLSVSLFKPDIDTLTKSWGQKYLYSQLALVIAYNYYFPNGAFRIYVDWYMLDSFKNFNDDILEINNLTDHPLGKSNDYEILTNNSYDISKLFKRFDNYIESNKYRISFKNAFEKFMYYYIIASKIYREDQTDDEITNEQGGDFFVYKFTDKNGSDFTEIINGKKCHISNGYIGQAIRYICLRQVDYNYNGNLIKRNKHYIWRDGHENQIGYNDALLIKSLNQASSQSKYKMYNLIPSNQYYITGWHSKVECPAESNKYYLRSAIAGIVQMTNFNETSEWMSDELYYNSIGMLFLLDNNNKVTLKQHRPIGRHYMNNRPLKDYEYGIEEYIFNFFFILDDFKKNNIYYPDRFPGQAIDLYELYNNPNPNLLVKTSGFLLYYLYSKNKLKNEINHYDFLKAIEDLRYEKISDINEKKWLGFLLSIFPTKYFNSLSFFNKSGDVYGHFKSRIDINNYISHLNNKYNENNIYLIKIKDLTWGYLNKIGINCNSPIINSNIEWCVNSYLKNIKDCPKNENFFSGFYYDEPKALEYGIFRNPEELIKLIKLIDTKRNMSLYKNIINN